MKSRRDCHIKSLRSVKPMVVQATRCRDAGVSCGDIFGGMWGDNRKSIYLDYSATEIEDRGTRSRSTKAYFCYKARRVLSCGTILPRSSAEPTPRSKAIMPTLCETMWAQNKLMDCGCGDTSSCMMRRRWGNSVETPSGADEEVAYCDRKDEMCKELEVRKRTLDEMTAALTYEGHQAGRHSSRIAVALEVIRVGE